MPEIDQETQAALDSIDEWSKAFASYLETVMTDDLRQSIFQDDPLYKALLEKRKSTAIALTAVVLNQDESSTKESD